MVLTQLEDLLVGRDPQMFPYHYGSHATKKSSGRFIP